MEELLSGKVKSKKYKVLDRIRFFFEKHGFSVCSTLANFLGINVKLEVKIIKFKARMILKGFFRNGFLNILIIINLFLSPLKFIFFWKKLNLISFIYILDWYTSSFVSFWSYPSSYL